jgi:hypothetical protein
MSATVTAPTPRRHPDHSRISLPKLHQRLTPALTDRRDRDARPFGGFLGGPPVRPA